MLSKELESFLLGFFFFLYFFFCWQRVLLVDLCLLQFALVELLNFREIWFFVGHFDWLCYCGSRITECKNPQNLLTRLLREKRR